MKVQYINIFTQMETRLLTIPIDSYLPSFWS